MSPRVGHAFLETAVSGLAVCRPTSIDVCGLLGASAGIRLAMELLLRGPDDGLLIPVPQYPLYAGLIIRGGGRAIPYFLEVGVTADRNSPLSCPPTRRRNM